MMCRWPLLSLYSIWWKSQRRAGHESCDFLSWPRCERVSKPLPRWGTLRVPLSVAKDIEQLQVGLDVKEKKTIIVLFFCLNRVKKNAVHTSSCYSCCILLTPIILNLQNVNFPTWLNSLSNPHCLDTFSSWYPISDSDPQEYECLDGALV